MTKYKKKVSIDFTGSCLNSLDNYKRLHKGETYTSAVNTIVETMFDLNPRVRKVITAACKNAFEEISKEKHTSGTFFSDEWERTLQQLNNVHIFFTEGISINEILIKNKVERVELKDGYALIPFEWSKIEIDSPTESLYAGVVEGMSADKPELLHYYFFSKKMIHLLSQKEKENILGKCTDLCGDVNIYEIPEYGARDFDCKNYPCYAMVVKNDIEPVFI